MRLRVREVKGSLRIVMWSGDKRLGDGEIVDDRRG